MFQKSPVLILLKSCPQFLLGIHHDGTVPGHRFSNRLPGNKQESERFFLGSNLDLIAGGKVRVDSLISAKAPLSEGASWFERLYKHEAGLMKVILTP